MNAPSTFSTKQAARRWLDTQRGLHLSGEWIDPRRGAMPFGEYAATWLAARPKTLSPKTRVYDEWLVGHIVAAFGAVPLGDIRPEVVRRWLAQANLPAATRAKTYRKLRQILGDAVRDELITRNPCTIDGAGVEPRTERRIATPEQVADLAAWAGDRYRALILTLAYGALRWGEACGLRRQDIDLATGTVTIFGQDVEVSGQITRRQPKTSAGVRVLTLPAFVTAELTAHLAAYVKPDPEALVFTAAEGGHLRASNWRQRIWRPAVDHVVGLPADFTVHELRHTGNTLAALSGASTRELMARMGHSSFAAALLYQHLAAGRDQSIAEFLERYGRAGR